MAVIEVGLPDGQRRSYEESELRELWFQGKLKPRAKYWKPGMSSWRFLFEYFAAVREPGAPSARPTPPAHPAAGRRPEE